MNEFWGTPTVAFGSVTFAIRSVRAGGSFLKEIQQAVADVNPNLAAAQVRTLADEDHGSRARTSFTLTMLLLAGSMGLLLGFIGIYGVIAYDVARRTREIGIRLALGAPAAALSGLVRPTRPEAGRRRHRSGDRRGDGDEPDYVRRLLRRRSASTRGPTPP